MVKRTMMALSALLCAGTLAFAAGTTESTQGAGSKLPIPDAANVTARGVFPVVKAPTTLRLAIPKSAKIEDYATNKYTKLIEEKSGVKFAFE